MAGSAGCLLVLLCQRFLRLPLLLFHGGILLVSGNESHTGHCWPTAHVVPLHLPSDTPTSLSAGHRPHWGHAGGRRSVPVWRLRRRLPGAACGTGWVATIGRGGWVSGKASVCVYKSRSGLVELLRGCGFVGGEQRLNLRSPTSRWRVPNTSIISAVRY